MKKLSTLSALLLTAASALCQGTVDFRNFGPTFATTAERRVTTETGQFLTGPTFMAQLYWEIGIARVGLGANTIVIGVAVTNAPMPFRGSTTTAPGYWVIPAGRSFYDNIDVASGQMATLQVRVWDSALGSTYEQAVAAGARHGTSGTFAYTVPGGSDPPDKYYMEGFRGFSLVPEPSVIILGAIGALAFLLRRRKS